MVPTIATLMTIKSLVLGQIRNELLKELNFPVVTLKGAKTPAKMSIKSV
jgi:hypothetical protein